MPKFRLRRPTDEAEQVEVTKSRRTKTSQPDLQVAAPEIAAKRRFGLPSFMKRKSQDASDQVSGNEAPAASTARSRADAKAEQRSEQRTEQSTTQSNVQSNQASSGPLSQARRMGQRQCEHRFKHGTKNQFSKSQQPTRRPTPLHPRAMTPPSPKRQRNAPGSAA